MGVYNTEEVTSAVLSERAQQMQSFFNSIEGITSEVATFEYEDNSYLGVKVNIPTIENSSIEAFFGNSTTGADDICVSYIKNGDRYLLSPLVYDGNKGNIKLKSYVDEKCIMLAAAEIGTLGNGFEIVYVNTSNNRYLVGYNTSRINNNNGYVDISNLSFQDRDSISGTVYTYTNMFPYTAPSGYIDFLGQSYFVNGGVKKYIVDILRECSTVDLLSSPSLTDGTFVALGTHCLAPVETEVEGG